PSRLRAEPRSDSRPTGSAGSTAGPVPFLVERNHYARLFPCKGGARQRATGGVGVLRCVQSTCKGGRRRRPGGDLRTKETSSCSHPVFEWCPKWSNPTRRACARLPSPFWGGRRMKESSRQRRKGWALASPNTPPARVAARLAAKRKASRVCSKAK